MWKSDTFFYTDVKEKRIRLKLYKVFKAQILFESKLLKLTQKGSENLNGPLTNKDTELVMKMLPTK